MLRPNDPIMYDTDMMASKIREATIAGLAHFIDLFPFCELLHLDELVMILTFNSEVLSDVVSWRRIQKGGAGRECARAEHG